MHRGVSSLEEFRGETFFDNLPTIADAPQLGERTQDERQKTRLAVEARAKLRLAMKYDRLRDRIKKGTCPWCTHLSRWQQDLLELG